MRGGRPAGHRGGGGGGAAAALISLVTLIGLGGPAEASLLGPLLRLLRPQLEDRLAEVCVDAVAGAERGLQRSLREPCRRLAAPASACLIEEAERSGRSFAMITELVAGRIGDDGEVVIRRCAARLLGLPSESFRDVSLEDLRRRLGDGR